ncbi:MAG: glycosyltransferase family 4 protein [Actinomycetota bacterium]|nr:glycosyltransferase family 4 protein [Actinomycetota bacterium]
MRRTLLVTNDFPPRAGGIQSSLHAIAQRLPPTELVVYAPAWDGAADFDAQQPFTVVRHPTSLMLPTPAVAGRAAALLADHRLTGVWFGAAAPLALLAPYLRRHGAERIVACTHGHEVGWSMLPGSRQALRAIGNGTDVLTFVSRYARQRFAAAFGANAALEYLPPGVDTDRFRPDLVARQRIRARFGLSEKPVIVCVSRLVARKGQDQLITALPAIRRASPGAMLLIVGGGPDADRLRRLAATHGVQDSVLFTGAVPADEVPAHFLAGDLFAMPCRTRGGGLDVEGLGIVFLEASACGLPVVAGDSGGAPEAVRQHSTGLVVDGTDREAIAAACIRVLGDAELRWDWGAAGRHWVQRDWNWQRSADRMVELLD